MLYWFLTSSADKRSSKEGDVSGHIKLNISATIDGERIRTPFHEQYTKLHEVRRWHSWILNLNLDRLGVSIFSNCSSTVTYTTKRNSSTFQQRWEVKGRSIYSTVIHFYLMRITYPSLKCHPSISYSNHVLGPASLCSSLTQRSLYHPTSQYWQFVV